MKGLVTALKWSFILVFAFQCSSRASLLEGIVIRDSVKSVSGIDSIESAVESVEDTVVDTVPVLQLFWPHGDGSLPEYVPKCISRSVVPITLLTMGAVKSNSVAGIDLEHEPMIKNDPARLQYIMKYRPWGISEPWEQHNTERFFVLRQYMAMKDLDVMVYIDSDVVVLDGSIRTLPKGCDAVLSLQGDKLGLMQWKTKDWVVWAGSSVLSKGVLDDFLQFVDKIYEEPYLDTLRDKRDSAPYVCDMTLWYLYTGAASPELAQLWGWPADPNVPTVPRKRFCDGHVYGIDHQHGHLRDGGKGLKTIHYQGGEKSKC